MEFLEIKNWSKFLGKIVNDFTFSNVIDEGPLYVIFLTKNEKTKIFLLRKAVINAKVLNLENDVYELRYKDFEDSELLTIDEILDENILLSKIEKLIKKYSKYE